jgi:hypothetical protein
MVHQAIKSATCVDSDRETCVANVIPPSNGGAECHVQANGKLGYAPTVGIAPNSSLDFPLRRRHGDVPGTTAPRAPVGARHLACL